MIRSYVPGGIVRENRPHESVRRSRVNEPSGAAICTAACGTRAPDGSIAAPLNAAKCSPFTGGVGGIERKELLTAEAGDKTHASANVRVVNLDPIMNTPMLHCAKDVVGRANTRTQKG